MSYAMGYLDKLAKLNNNTGLIDNSQNNILLGKKSNVKSGLLLNDYKWNTNNKLIMSNLDDMRVNT